METLILMMAAVTTVGLIGIFAVYNFDKKMSKVYAK